MLLYNAQLFLASCKKNVSTSFKDSTLETLTDPGPIQKFCCWTYFTLSYTPLFFSTWKTQEKTHNSDVMDVRNVMGKPNKTSQLYRLMISAILSTYLTDT